MRHAASGCVSLGCRILGLTLHLRLRLLGQRATLPQCSVFLGFVVWG